MGASGARGGPRASRRARASATAGALALLALLVLLGWACPVSGEATVADVKGSGGGGGDAAAAAGEQGEPAQQESEYGNIEVDEDELEDEDEDGDGEAFRSNDKDLDNGFHMDDFSPSHVFTFPVESYEECFFEDIKTAPMRIRGAYFVSSEGSMDVAVSVARVIDQEKRKEDELFSDSRKSEGVFNLVAQTAGQYKVCFRSSSGGKRVTFALHVGVRKREHAKQEHITPMGATIRECHRSLQQIVSEQNYLNMRVRRHMVTQDSTEWRIGYYTVFESVFMVGITLAQIFYVQRLINNRQWV